MPKEEKITLEAEVVEALPDAKFKVKLENGPGTTGLGQRKDEEVLYSYSPWRQSHRGDEPVRPHQGKNHIPTLSRDTSRRSVHAVDKDRDHEGSKQHQTSHEGLPDRHSKRQALRDQQEEPPAEAASRLIAIRRPDYATYCRRRYS